MSMMSMFYRSSKYAALRRSYPTTVLDVDISHCTKHETAQIALEPYTNSVYECEMTSHNPNSFPASARSYARNVHVMY